MAHSSALGIESGSLFDSGGESSPPHARLLLRCVCLMKDDMPTPWPPHEPACYGLTCNRHSACARYAAVEGNDNHAQVFIGHCGPETVEFKPAGWQPEMASLLSATAWEVR